MDALVPAFIVAALAEFGDRTQLLAILLGQRFGRPGAVVAGIALGTLLNCAIGGVAGAYFATLISHRAIQLMTGVALILAGIGAVLKVKQPDPVDGWRLGAFLSSAAAFFVYALFDKTQFVVGAIAAGSGEPVLTTLGATAGVTLANLPAVLIGERWPRAVPLKAIRIGAGALLVVAGLAIGLQALQLA